MTASKNTFAAKFGVAVVAVAMVFSFFAPTTQAQTAEELQAMINDLLAQIEALQSQVGHGGTGSAPAGVCPYTWTRNLTIGDRGEDVMRLQQLLNSDPDTRVSATGVGSAGMETEYFGALTADAVSRMQMKYRSEILTPLGIMNPTGFFGASSRAKANSLCVMPVEPEPDPDPIEPDPDPDPVDPEPDPGPALHGGEASLENFRMRSGEITDAREGQRDVPVAEIEFDVEDGDVSVSRLDLAFEGTSGTAEDRPWEAFRSVSLWVDGDKVAERYVDNRADWSRNTPSTGQHRVRFTGLDMVFRDGDRAEIVVAVSVNGTVRGLLSETSNWDVFVPDMGLRARDGMGIDSFEGDDDDTVSFFIEEAGADDELRVRTSSSDPSATTIEVDDRNRSAFINVFSFELDSRNSNNEIEVMEIPVEVTLNTGSTIAPLDDVHDQVINDMRLVIDGQVYRDFRWNGASNPGGDDVLRIADFSFDDELFIDGRVTARLEVRFNRLDTSVNPRFAEGTTIQSKVVGDDITAEGANDVTPAGTVTSEEHTLRSEGVQTELVSYSSESFTDDEVRSYTMRVEVTAIGDDMTVAEAATTSIATPYGFAYEVDGPDSDPTVSATVSRVSGGTRIAGTPDSYRISEGATAIFDVVVTVSDADTPGQYRVTLTDVGFTPEGKSWTSEELTPASDFRTGTEYIAGGL